MTLKNTEDFYGLITKILHWVVGFMIISMIIVGFVMQNIENTADKAQIYNLHKATGMVVLILVSIRLVWRLVNITVIMSDNSPKWQHILAIMNINMLYILMFLMPISGFLASIFSGRNIDIYGLFAIKSYGYNPFFADVFNQTHSFSAFVLCCLIIIHLLAVIYNNVINKNDVFSRMWFSNKNI
jgi:cytochrome b561